MTPTIREKLDAHAEELRRDYLSSRPRSAALAARAPAVLPGGNSRYTIHFDPFPFYAAAGSGAVLTDVDGHEYVDLVNNFTSLIHGHAHAATVEAIRRQADRGTAFGTGTEAEIELGDIIRQRVESIDLVRFTNSGTEAVLYAIRAARTFTGRDAIVKVEGGYDGGTDTVMVSVRNLGERPGEGIPEHGIPAAVADETHVIPFNDAAQAAEILERVASTAAAVIVEPIQGLAGVLTAEPGYLAVITNATRAAGSLLIADEVMCFRVGYGGAQRVVGLEPDITTLGKIIGGGLPVGAFGGRADVMEIMDQRRQGFLAHAGTYNGNALTMAAGLATLQHLTLAEVDRINHNGRRLHAHVTTRLQAEGLPMTATNAGSLVQLHHTAVVPRSVRDTVVDMDVAEVLFLLLLRHGVFVAPGRLLMSVSTALSDRQLTHVEHALTDSFAKLAAWLS